MKESWGTNIFGTVISLVVFTNLNIVGEKMKAKQKQVVERARVNRAFSRFMGLGKKLLQRTRPPCPLEQSQFSPET